MVLQEQQAWCIFILAVLGIDGSLVQNAVSLCRHRQLMSLWRPFKCLRLEPSFTSGRRAAIYGHDWALMYGEWEKFLLDTEPGVATPPHPRLSGLWRFWQACHKSLFCFISSVLWSVRRQQAKCDYSAKFCEGKLQLCGSRCIYNPPPQGINSQTQTWTHMPQHTPVHKIHTHASKQACTIAPALISFVSLAHTHKKKQPRRHNHPATQIRTWSRHDAASRQAGTAPEEVILFLFVQQRRGRGR